MSGLPIARPKISEHKSLMITLVLTTRYLLKSSIEAYKSLKQKNAWISGIFYVITNSLKQSKNESFILVNTT